MAKKEKLKCKFNHQTGEFICRDKKGNTKLKGRCARNPKGKQGGICLMGTGGQYGNSNTEIICDDDKDMERQLQKKYKDYDIELED